MKSKMVSQSRAIKSLIVLPPDSNTLGTMFGGKVMAYIDESASISAFRHARSPIVTASTDSVDFLHPITVGHMICLESFVTWTHNTSMEVFVNVISEDMMTGERQICTTAFLTFVALDDKGKPTPVPQVIPETDFEKELHATAPERYQQRMERKAHSKARAKKFTIDRK